jgi:hypothetical protein
MSEPNPFSALLKGVAASLFIYWFGVWVVQEIAAEQLIPYARYIGWAACAIATLVTAYSVGEPWDRAVLFAFAAFVAAIPMAILAESAKLLRVLTFAARVEAVSGARVNIVAQNRYLAFHVLPAIFLGITIICLAGTLMFRQRPDRY